MTDLNRIVSSESEELILVDERDNEIGYRSKGECHDADGIMHRAFSLFLFSEDGELLLQQRSTRKRLWPGFWSNTCCSHPRRGESLDVATARRLDDELNIVAHLEHIYHFCYQASFGQEGSENELCHVFLGRLEGTVRPNDSEIDSVCFVTPQELAARLSRHPEQFTPWFKQEWQTLTGEYSERLMRYAM